MFTIKEIKAKKIPSITSLEFELNVYNKELFDLLVKIQGAIFDKETNKFEFPLNKLYFLIDILTRYDDVEFITYNEKKKEKISCKGMKFKCKPYQHQIEAIDFGLNHNKWMLLDDQGLGKLEPLSSLIPTPNGFVKMGDLCVGDKVFGLDGKEHHILNIYPHKDKEIYKVTFNDDSVAYCGDEHLWTVRTPTMRCKNLGWRVKTLREIMDEGLRYKSGMLRWEIPQVAPVEYKERDFLIDPYIIGVAIGDGSMSTGRVDLSISDQDMFIAEKVESLLHKEYKLSENRSTSCPRYSIVQKKNKSFNEYNREMKKLGMNVLSREKFVPELYKIASIEQRKAILAGLLDTDGSVSSTKGRVTYSTTSCKLADDIIEIVNSLGGTARKTLYAYKEKQCYSISITCPFNPFTLPRKAEKYCKKTNRYLSRYIKDVVFDRREDARCIMVDADDHIYLTSRNYIPTHNTVSIIYLAEVLKKKENLKHCLIICGVNSLKYNWVDEIQKFSDLSCRILGQKISKTGKVSIGSVTERCKELKNGIKEFFVITNLETLQNKMFLDSFKKSKSTFDLIVVDEGHKVKNPSSMSAKTLMKLEANRKVVLSGTIIMNDPENAYVPLKWTENIGSNCTQFKSMFNVYGGFGGVQVIGHKNLDTLKELINSCSLRRLKDEVLDLPIKNYKTEYVELKPQQKKLYDEVKEGVLAELDKLPSPPTIIQELTINMRLRQITTTPTILSDTITQSAKLDRLEELVDEITSQGDKVVIMNTFKGAVEEENKRLKKYEPLVCTGDQKDEEISKNKKIFETNSDRKVMICTWQKMGTGHTLTAANYLIFVDTPWTRADFDQTADRIYRIGQKKPVFIITMITKDTYDERVQQILDRKEQLSSFLLDDGKNTDMLNLIEE